jgi:D-3-phosphoglycerate dehydrogenase
MVPDNFTKFISCQNHWKTTMIIENIIFEFDNTLIDGHSQMIFLDSISGRKSLVTKKIPGSAVEQQKQEFSAAAPHDWDSLLQKVKPLAIDDFDGIARSLVDRLFPQVKEVISLLQSSGRKIFLFSTSLDLLVKPVADHLGICQDNVFTNRVVTKDHRIIGTDTSRPLSQSLGKLYLAEKLRSEGRLSGSTAIVGQSRSAVAIRRNDIAEMFIYFTGEKENEEIREQADFVIDRFDQLLSLFFSDDELSNMSVSFESPVVTSPRLGKAPKILLLENIHPKASSRLSGIGFQITSQKSALDEKDLIQRGRGFHALGIRSKTHISAKTIGELKDLWVIGAFCIGTSQIDLDAAAQAGIPVFNAPYSNTRSVAELVVGETVMLMRRIFEKSTAAHQGRWLKTAQGSTEIRGKTAGIVGYGHIGSQVSVLLENLGMSVMFYDIVDKLPLGNAQQAASLYDLLEAADIITMHVPDTKETRGMIGKNELQRMKDGAFLINSSRGKVVDLVALKEAIEAGHIAGAAVDVFPDEPNRPDDEFSTPLQGLSNVILTPHIGGSTTEAQENIASYVSYKIEKYLTTGSTTGAVNFPEVDIPRLEGKHRILHIHKNVPGVLAKINTIFSQRRINVEGQMLQTRGDIGYLIVDVDHQISEQVFQLMLHITETIQVRRIT